MGDAGEHISDVVGAFLSGELGHGRLVFGAPREALTFAGGLFEVEL